MGNREEHYIKNRDKILAYKKKHYLENKDRILEYKRKHYNGSNYYESNREEILKKVKKYQEKHPGYCKLWYEKNREKKKEYSKQNKGKRKESNRLYYINNRKNIIKRANQHQKNKRKTDPKYNLNCRMAISIGKSLKGNKAGRHWESLIGYTLNDLIKRLEKTLPKSYTWKDFLEGKLHIDHIIPISAFNFTKSEHPDFKKCWALKNLQLLPAMENIIKSNKLKKPFQPALKISLISKLTPISA